MSVFIVIVLVITIVMDKIKIIIVTTIVMDKIKIIKIIIKNHQE